MLLLEENIHLSNAEARRRFPFRKQSMSIVIYIQ